MLSNRIEQSFGAQTRGSRGECRRAGFGSHNQGAQTRALLGRGDDALADAELAVSNGQGSDYANAGSRHEQLLMRRLREAGQHKRASTILAKQMAAFANKGRGKLFGLNYQAAIGYIRNGDTNAAETAIARNRSLLAEAQRVGDPEHLKVFADAGAAETWFGENHAASVSRSPLLCQQ